MFDDDRQMEVIKRGTVDLVNEGKSLEINLRVLSENKPLKGEAWTRPTRHRIFIWSYSGSKRAEFQG